MNVANRGVTTRFAVALTVAAAGVLALSGCEQPGVTAIAASDQFVSWVREARLGVPDLKTAPDEDIVKLGDRSCEIINYSPDVDSVAQQFLDASLSGSTSRISDFPTLEDSRKFVEASVTYLCPELSSKLDASAAG